MAKEYGDLVLLEPHEGHAIIRLNRPDKRNAMNFAAQKEFRAALDAVRNDAPVVILTGNGPAFCAGIDLKESRANATDENGNPIQRTWIDLLEAVRTHPAVTIAAVNGFALGGGLTLINSCDLAIAVDNVEIGMPELGLGIYPAMAGPSTQIRLSRKRAAWMVLTTDRITGAQAVDWGLVNKAVAAEDLMDEAVSVARKIAGFDPAAVAGAKQALLTVPDHISAWVPALEYGALVNKAASGHGAAPGKKKPQ